MNLKQQFVNDYKEAMKAKDEVGKNTINMARAAIKQYEIDNREEIDEAGIIAIISKQVKMRKDAERDFEAGGRMDLVESTRAEIRILERYLPEQLSDEKIREIVETKAKELGVENGKQNMGKLMKPVMSEIKGLADGNTVRKIIEDFLAE